MNPIFYQFAKLTKHVPLNIFIRGTKKREIYPFYHAVANEELIHIKNLYQVRSSKEFEKDLDFFLKYYKPIDYLTYKNNFDTGNPAKENTFLLTFDDGLREFHDIIAPILIRKGIPAVCFLNSAFIGNKDLFFRYKASILIEKLNQPQLTIGQQKKTEDWFHNQKLPYSPGSLSLVDYSNRNSLDELAGILDVDFKEYLQRVKPYLDSNQINSLIHQGFQFGAHSIDHPLFSELEIKQQKVQIEQSTKEITETFKLDYKIFSFPFTDFGVRMELFHEIFNNPSPLCNMTFGCAGIKDDSCKKNIQRIAIERNNYTAQEVIYAEYYYYMLKALLNKNTIRRRS